MIEDGDVEAAVEQFWFVRDEQTARLADLGVSGGSARANGHLGGITRLVARLFLEAGLGPSDITLGAPYLPGYYRVRKQWDLVARYHGHLVAAVEFKSQVGSVGKNYNNRFEEALGTATDIAAAQLKYQAFGTVPPWLAYVFVLQESDETERPRGASALFPVDSAFAGLSYNGRYQLMLTRFLSDQVYNAGWFLTTRRTGNSGITFEQPLAIATLRSFAVAVEGRVNFVKAVAEQE